MTSLRRLAVLSLATLLTGLVLVIAVANDVSGPSVAGIEREGDIPLPVALG